MRIVISMLSFAAAIFGMALAAVPWTTDYQKSSVQFRAVQEGTQFTGSFDEFTLDIALDPNDLSDASVRATFDMSSADAGDRDRNSSLPTKDWFFIKSFPTAQFVSTKIIGVDDGSYKAIGKLSLKGIDKDVTLPFSLVIDGDNAHAKGQVSLNRRDFNVGDGAFKTDTWVGFDVLVLIDIVATRTPLAP